MIVCCDLDGVIWRGDTAIPGSAAGVARLQESGLRVVFLTNNSSGTVEDYVAKLRDVGVGRGAGRCREQRAGRRGAACRVARTRRARARVCRRRGRRRRWIAAGFEVVDRAPADAVVVGWHREFDFERLTRASDAVRAGARFVATNIDPTYPVAGGLCPARARWSRPSRPRPGGNPRSRASPSPRRSRSSGSASALRAWSSAIVRRPTARSRRRWVGRSRLVLSGVAGSHGEEPVPEPPPPFVAADLGALAPTLIAAYAHA